MVQATYNSKRLDWILVSSDLEFVDYHVVNDELSDHRLVVTTLRWKDT
jgi:endonuclease/exonuclease/phosphatase family metal-dependent hydrolase